MPEQDQNRTEQATPFKLEEAKKRGQVAKSLDLNSLIAVSGLLLSLSVWGAATWHQLCDLCAALFASAGTLLVTHESTTATGAGIAYQMLALLSPFIGVGVVCSVVANLIQTGPVISGEPLKPQFERLNPMAGFKRIYNVRVVFEAVKSVLKLAGLGTVAIGFFFALWSALPGVEGAGVGYQANWLGSMTSTLLFRLVLAMVLIAILDLLFVRWQYRKQMMMSKRELKEETKRREGDPLVRAKIRELQRENRKQARSLSRVKDADVLITNPEHIAIALRYDRLRMNAPVVIAKGVDESAARMRALAATCGVPRFERRRLARHLFRRVAIDHPVPSECFVDVARIYAEVNERRSDRLQYEVTT
jgi:flagellar biosynthetic protein FlhB